MNFIRVVLSIANDVLATIYSVIGKVTAIITSILTLLASSGLITYYTFYKSKVEEQKQQIQPAIKIFKELEEKAKSQP